MLIKIVNGTYGHRPTLANGTKSPYIVPVKPNSPPIDVEEDEARRLISIGVAIAVKDETAPAAPAKVSPNGNTEAKAQAPEEPAEATVTGYLDAEQLKEMSFDELKALAKDMGIAITGIRSKAGLIEAITAVEAEAGGEPVLDVQDVID